MLPTHQGLEPDLDRVLESCSQDLRALRDSRVLILGGTGFVGSWLLELLTWGSDRLGVELHVDVASRDPGRFVRARPHLAGHRSVYLRRADVRTQMSSVDYDFVIAGAAASAASGDARDDREVAEVQDANAAIARRCLDASAARVLLLSSGAAGGRSSDAYSVAKRQAEDQVRLNGRCAVIARLYAFVGPYLPLDLNFAAGNFIADVLAGRSVQVRGDGRPTRTYLYPADMAAWLWSLVVRGQPGDIYDVGSSEEVSIAELAHRVARLGGREVGVVIGGGVVPSSAEDRYVPDLSAGKALGLAQHWTLDEALERTYAWHNLLVPAR